MSEKVALKILRCPTCGASLKAENKNEAVTCLFCGNTIVPVEEAPAAVSQGGSTAGFGGTVKVEGIKTPASALAYLEEFFEEYDWEAFTYAQSLSVEEIDQLVNSLKTTTADDKNTWFACFKAAAVPFINKVEGWQKILASVIEEYKQDSLDAYSKFDAYKRIALRITAHRSEITANLEKLLTKAAKYGASREELGELQAYVDRIKDVSLGEIYGDVEEIPAVKAFIAEKNARIVKELAAAGINAEAEYARAKTLMEEERYVEALNVLLSLRGYSDTEALIEKLDDYFLLGDVLKVEGKLYYFKSSVTDGDKTLNLHPCVDGKISGKAIIRGINQIVTNHADTLYYLNSENKLMQYDLSLDLENRILETPVVKKEYYRYGRKLLLLVRKRNDDFARAADVVELDLTTGTTKTLLEKIEKILSVTDNKLLYTVPEKNEEGSAKTETRILNLDTLETVSLGTRKVTVEGYLENCVVYTRIAPNACNMNLYIRELKENAPEKQVEKNIYEFCEILGDSLLYYIGNSQNRTLIQINRDGTGRREWPRHISQVLFERAGWLYFIRRSGYNAILCRSRLDGSKYRIIASDIDEFVEIKNGYLYYLNDEASLVKVRMDGSNRQTLCLNVEAVLSVKEDKIIFVSADDRINTEDALQTARTVKSIYAVEFSGSGKIKLAYDINKAKEYDDNTVYYLATKKNKDTAGQTQYQDNLYELDVQTNQVTKLLVLETVEPETEQGLSVFAILMIIACIAFFFGFVTLVAGAPGMGLVCLFAGLILILIGFVVKAGKENEG